MKSGKNSLVVDQESISKLLPDCCVFLLDEVADKQKELFNEEKTLLTNPSPSRMNEFASGRFLARKAGMALGVKIDAILMDPIGCPIWPPGIQGSISHKGDLCGVIITNSLQLKSLGLDIEERENLDQQVWSTFCTGKELSIGPDLGFEEVEFANILFSVKEALFKCLYPILQRTTPNLAEIGIQIKSQLKQGVMEVESDKYNCSGYVLINDSHIFSLLFSQI